MEIVQPDKKYLKRVDLKIVQRILHSLMNDGDAKKTILARRTNISYDCFILYLEFLDMIGSVKREINNGTEVVILSDLGRIFYLRRFSTVKRKSIQRTLQKKLV